MSVAVIIGIIRRFGPYAVAVVILAAAIAYAHHAGYAAGQAHVRDAWDAERAQQATAAMEASLTAMTEQQANTRAAVDAAARADARQQNIRVVYAVITQTVTKYVHDHPALSACGLDDDGLRLWNEANSGAVAGITGETGDRGQSAGAMPAPAAGQ